MPHDGWYNCTFEINLSFLKFMKVMFTGENEMKKIKAHVKLHVLFLTNKHTTFQLRN